MQGGITINEIFQFLHALHRDITIPMVGMTYANVVFSYGTERLLAACKEVQIDGLILPDLPFEEKEEFLPFCRKYRVDLISLIAPTLKNRASIIQVVRENTSISYAIGFGNSAPEQTQNMAALSDGTIVKLLEQYGRNAPTHIGEYVKTMKSAVSSFCK